VQNLAMARAANAGSRKGKKIVKRHGAISHESLSAARLKLAMPFDQDLVSRELQNRQASRSVHYTKPNHVFGPAAFR